MNADFTSQKPTKITEGKMSGPLFSPFPPVKQLTAGAAKAVAGRAGGHERQTKGSTETDVAADAAEQPVDC